MLDASAILGQLADEFTARVRAGEMPAVEDYAARHPDLAGRIRELFPTLLMLEGLAAGRGERATGSDHVGRSFGPYRVVREIGRGGMGVVYEAVHEPLHKRVALKLLTLSGSGAAGQLERFFREAQTAAGLHHTNIVPVFDIGQVGGTPYYAMQYIEGRGLDHALRDNEGARSASKATPTVDLPTDAPTLAPGTEPLLALRAPIENCGGTMSHFRWVADVGIQAADGLAYAHERGVIHRDIKPSNLIQDDRGVVWIADFGLARRVDDPGLTKSGALVGTPRYMSPEQAEAAKKPIDHRTDVYSLGATLYELLTRQPAFDGPTPLDVVMQILERTPVSPRTLDPAVPRDLETIVLKAMAKRADDRYPSARALGADLKAWRDDRPIAARRIGPLGRFVRWSRRNPLVAGLTAVVFALLLVTAIGSVIAAITIRDERNQARSYLDTMLVGTSLLHLEQAKSSLASTADGRRWNALNHLRLADHYAKPYRASRPDEVPSLADLRSVAVAALVTFDGIAVREINAGMSLAAPPVISSNGRFAVVSRQRPAGNWDLEWIDLTTGKVTATHPLPEDTKPLAKSIGADVNLVEKLLPHALSPDGRTIARDKLRRQIELWNSDSAPASHLIWPGLAANDPGNETDLMVQIAFSPTGTHCAAVARVGDGDDREVALWEMRNERPGRILSKGKLSRAGVAFSSDGKKLAVPTGMQTIAIHDLTKPDAKPLAIELPRVPDVALALDADGRQLAAICWGAGNELDSVILFDIAAGRLSATIDLGNISPEALAFDPAGLRLVVCDGQHNDLLLYDLRTQDLLTKLHHNALSAANMLCWQDERRLVSADNYGAIRVWELADVAPLGVTLLDVNVRTPVAVSPDGQFIAGLAADQSDQLFICDRNTGHKLRVWATPMKASEVRPWGLLFSPDSRQIALVTEDAVAVWEIASGQMQPAVPATVLAKREWSAASFSADGRLLLVGVHDGVRDVFDYSRQHSLFAMTDPRRKSNDLHIAGFIDDGRRLVDIPEDPDPAEKSTPPILIWDIATGKATAEWRLPQGVESIDGHYESTLSPDGRKLAVETLANSIATLPTTTLFLRDLERGTQTRLMQSTAAPWYAAFSPDSRLLAIGLAARDVHVFDTSKGDLLFRWPTRLRNTDVLTFTPDGKTLIASDNNGSRLETLRLDALRIQLAELGLDW